MYRPIWWQELVGDCHVTEIALSQHAMNTGASDFDLNQYTFNQFCIQYLLDNWKNGYAKYDVFDQYVKNLLQTAINEYRYFSIEIPNFYNLIKSTQFNIKQIANFEDWNIYPLSEYYIFDYDQFCNGEKAVVTRPSGFLLFDILDGYPNHIATTYDTETAKNWLLDAKYKIFQQLLWSKI